MTVRADTETLALYEEAVDRLPPLSRVVFLLHRVDDLSYVEIADGLSITIPVVEACIVEALSVICATVDRTMYRPRPRQLIAEAEATLHHRYRAHCHRRLNEVGIAGWTLRVIRRVTGKRPTFEQWLLGLTRPRA
ncbi:sigma factor-like helix-turn-helix DNA-binding protein [Sphingomonas sp.]|uniref:sigma factor-like helix-turn-helix DNA-binding protein n=1 Tax=Sphingomonas sp. TaxID=28214 RepID=UPI003D6D800D